jgi:C-terminal processing protease CtpA/Prc
MARAGRWAKPDRRIAPNAAYSPARKVHPNEPYPLKELRLLAGIQIWAIFQYFFPYKHLIGEDWDQVLLDSLPKLEAAASAEEYFLAIAGMLAHTHDSHVGATSPNAPPQLVGAATALMLRMVEGKPVVVGLRGKVEGVVVGDIIRKIDGKPVEERLNFLVRHQASSTPQSRDLRSVSILLNGPDGSAVEVEIDDSKGTVRTVRLERKPVKDQTPLPKTEVMKMLPGNTGYVDLAQLTTEQVDQMFEKFKDTTGVIMDMRGYPRSTAWSIAPRLAEKENIGAALFQRPTVRAPTSLNHTFAFVQRISPARKPRYTGKTIMLIDARAISQAEHSGLHYEMVNGTKFVGSPTAGANGDVTSFSVPGGIRVRFTGHDVRHADGRQLQRVGLQPHVLVEPTIAGIRAGKDEVLERAMAYMKELVQAGGPPK